MKLLSTILLLIFSWSAAAEEKNPAIKESSIYRTTVSAAKSLVVFEGLPHQRREGDIFATEIKRDDAKKIGTYPFYTPGIDAKNADQLRKLLSSSASIAVYGGPRLCGGYHPDYCISWTAGEATYHALICFGCHGIVFHDGKTSLKYDLSPEASLRFLRLLAAYESKRPKPKKQTNNADPFD